MRLIVKDDFDLEKIAESGQCFRWEKLEHDVFRIPHRGKCLYIRRIAGAEYELDCTGEDLPVWEEYFDLGQDYRKIRAAIGPDDEFLLRAARSERGIRILRQDPWEALISFIISQNRNIPAIRKSIELLCRAAGKRLTDGRGLPFYAFPEPKAILALDGASLDGCKLGYRGKYVRAAAEAVSGGALRLDGCGEARALTVLYGVGTKVANCVALYGLHNLDAFPVDTWVRRILENEYGGGYPYEKYSPYNGIYQQYMFAYYRKSGR